ncbi:YcxB family protein, partial [Stenotrophomonas sp. A3_2]|uniref:YcxB family protein n=1 Tax=Stenotrophomonas sp. A3_2 TaxID=3119978 RepID=UPI002FC35DA7
AGIGTVVWVSHAGQARLLAEYVFYSFAFVMGFVFLLVLRVIWAGWQDFRRQGLAEKRISLSWSDSGVEVGDGVSFSHIAWRDVRRVHVSRGIVLIEFINLTRLIVPRRALTQLQIDDLLSRPAAV